MTTMTDTRTVSRIHPGAVPAGQEPREAPTSWWQTEEPRERVLERTLALPFTASSDANQRTRERGLVKLLDWLEHQPGSTWQDRWLASGAMRQAGSGHACPWSGSSTISGPADTTARTCAAA